MSIASAFPPDVGDACGNFFGTALRACNPPIAPNSHCLEIGCAEFNALKYATKAWPEMSFVGIDWRASKPTGGRETRIQGDVITHTFEPESFDWIYSISAIEHIGLGHYENDPKDVDGDKKAMVNAHRWLKPGGWMYLDVPWRPGLHEYQVYGTSHRIYDDDALRLRFQVGALWSLCWSGVVRTNATHQLIAPEPLPEPHQFYYIGMWLQKK